MSGQEEAALGWNRGHVPAGRESTGAHGTQLQTHGPLPLEKHQLWKPIPHSLVRTSGIPNPKPSGALNSQGQGWGRQIKLRKMQHDRGGRASILQTAGLDQGLGTVVDRTCSPLSPWRPAPLSPLPCSKGQPGKAGREKAASPPCTHPRRRPTSLRFPFGEDTDIARQLNKSDVRGGGWAREPGSGRAGRPDSIQDPHVMGHTSRECTRASWGRHALVGTVWQKASRGSRGVGVR